MSMKRMKHLLVLCLALVMVVGLLSVTALAAGDTVTLVYHGNGGMNGDKDTSTSTATLDAEATLKSNPFTWHGYTFMGWALSADGEVAYQGSEKVILSDTTFPGLSESKSLDFYAVWAATPPQAPTMDDFASSDFKVKIDCVDTSDSPDATYSLAEFDGSAEFSKVDDFNYNLVISAAPFVSDYQSNQEVKHVISGDSTKSVLFTWSPEKQSWNLHAASVTFDVISDYYTLVYDGNGGKTANDTNTATSQFRYGAEATIKSSNFTRDGYTFLGWSLTPDGEVEYSESEDVAFNDEKFPGLLKNGKATLYAVWEKDAVEPEPTPDPDPEPANCYVDANFPTRLLTGTYRDVSISIWEDFGLSWQENATLYVEVDGPAYSDADLWYYDSDAGYWFDGKYVDTVRLGQVPGTWTFNETGVTIPLSLYLDRAGTYDFTFTLKADDGTILATDTATVRAYTETHDDYRIYLDCGRHGSISTSPSTWADYKDTVTIYVNPDKGYELDTLRVYDKDKDRVSIYTNHRGDYTFTMPKSSVTVYATFKEVNYDHFVDVSRDSWYYDAVYYVYDHDIMDGVGNRKFDPYGDLSRAMIVTTLYRLEDEPRVRNYGTFRDVDEDAWYADAVEWAAEEGIVKGYGKKTFGPNNSVTVEQLAAILQRYADYKGYDIDETVRLYSDAVVSQWAVDNVRWAVAEDLLRGGRSVNATKVATRAEIAYALYNFMMNVVD